MPTQSLEDALDRLVAEYSERLAQGEQGEKDLLAKVPEAHRAELARCFKMMRAGIARAPRASAALGPGVVLGGYRIEREIGRGGMATVYLARQLDLDRRVALKVLRPGLAIDARHVDRFRREALAIARLQHPHIVQVHAVGETDGHHWIAMEHVDGTSLADVYDALPAVEKRTAADLARATGLDPRSLAGQSYERALCALLAPVARALAVAHDLGIVHRDVKPSNILIHRDGRAVIADFGLAKGDGDPGLSLTGEPIGTPFYMSPEQATLAAAKVDQRSDVYSFGVTLYEGLAGARPFEGETVLAVLDLVRRGHPTPLRARNREASREAEAVVRRAMEREAERRYPSALQLAADLEALAQGATTQARAREGGALRRLQRDIQAWNRGEIREYRSPREFLGLPLVHVFLGRRNAGERTRFARGWLAVGDVALGGVTFGGVSLGLLSFGGLAFGLLFAFGGFALGGAAFGGFAAGGLALGGFAAGFSAIGGMCYGYYAFGGFADGAHVVTVRLRDPAAVEWFRALFGWLPFVPAARWFERWLERR